MSIYRKWSEQEIKQLVNLYPNIRVKGLAASFPFRNKNTIVVKALSLRLPSAKLWQKGENLILKKYFENYSRADIIKFLPRRSWAAIIARGERLGLKRKTNKPRKCVNESYFKKWSANMAYILGFILSDGCIIKGTYKGYSDSLKFGVQKRDVDILEKIKRELRSGHVISYVRNAVHFSISSNTIVSDLKKLGIDYRKSLREKIPAVPLKYMKDFIRGIIDGDGSIYFDKKGYPRISVTGGMTTMTYIREHFLKKLGAYSSLSKLSYSPGAKAYLYSIGYGSNTAKKIIRYLYGEATLFLNRKYLLARRVLSKEIKVRKGYSIEENRYLMDYYLKSPKKQIMKQIKKNWGSIQKRARFLNLYKNNKIVL